MSKYLKPDENINAVLLDIRDTFPNALPTLTEYVPSSINQILEIISLITQFVVIPTKVTHDRILLAQVEGPDNTFSILNWIQYNHHCAERGKNAEKYLYIYSTS